MKTNARHRAFEILVQMMKRQQSLSVLLTPTDTALTQALCFGVCRSYFRLERLIDKLVNKRPPLIEVWVALMMGVYQLQAMNKAAYAVVQETVDLLDTPKLVHAKGFVNAILRRLCREKDSHALDKMGEGEPAWLLAKLKQDWPTDWQSITQANDEHPPMTLRVNLAKTTRDLYLSRLEKAGIAAQPIAEVDSAIVLEKPIDVRELPGFVKGEVSVQDVAAQHAAALLDLKPGLRVLDACTAPGGKLCHLLEMASDLKACVAVDKDESRLARVTENLTRLQLQANVMTADLRELDSWWDGQLFDRILLDAPCSGTGVIRRHPDIRVLRQPKEVESIVAVQAALLDNLWKILAPGGRLVYATCSVLRQENDLQIKKFLSRTPDAKSVSLSLPWGRAMNSGWQLLPGEGSGDGFYYAALEKATAL